MTGLGFTTGGIEEAYALWGISSRQVSCILRFSLIRPRISLNSSA